MGLELTALLFITMKNLSLEENLEIPSVRLHCFGSRPLCLDKSKMLNTSKCSGRERSH